MMDQRQEIEEEVVAEQRSGRRSAMLASTRRSGTRPRIMGPVSRLESAGMEMVRDFEC